MSITDFEVLLKVIPIEQNNRSILRDGYATLLTLGWPTHFINWKMCERACADLVPAYGGIASWHAYKEAWAREDIKRG
jgi:hypothetical protein